MIATYIEAIAFAKPTADRGAIEAWLIKEGFQNVSSMQVGLYFGGSAKQFESVFKVDISKPPATWKLEVLPALHNDVEHFEIASPPQYHA